MAHTIKLNEKTLELMKSELNTLGTSYDVDSRKNSLDKLFKLNAKSNVMFKSVMSVQEEGHMAVVDHFFDLLQQNGRQLNADVCSKPRHIPHAVAVKILNHIECSKHDADSKYKFAEWLLKSSSTTSAQQDDILTRSLLILNHLQLSTIKLNASLDLACAMGNAHLIKLSAYLGADLQNLYSQFSKDRTGVDWLRFITYLDQAHLKSPACVEALLSCGYKLSERDIQQFTTQHNFIQVVKDCLRTVRPLTPTTNTQYIMKYLSIALSCDMPILEAVYCSFNGINQKTRSIVEAIEQNKKQMGI